MLETGETRQTGVLSLSARSMATKKLRMPSAPGISGARTGLAIRLMSPMPRFR